MSKEAMKLALEALENTTPTGFNMESDKKFFAAIAALREALNAPLAEQPAQRKPLTDKEMFEAIRQLYSSDKVARLAVSHSKDEYRAIEAAHGIKENT